MYKLRQDLMQMGAGSVFFTRGGFPDLQSCKYFYIIYLRN